MQNSSPAPRLPSPAFKVALLTFRDLPGLNADDRLLLPRLEERGVSARPAVWDDPSVDWDGFDALVVRSPWDYFQRAPEFLAWLDARAKGPALLLNDLAIIRWNFDKRYLAEVERKGSPIVPSLFIEQGSKVELAALAAARGWTELVAKPCVSGSAWRTLRFHRDQAAQHAAALAETLRDCALIVQPFLPEILADGELSLMFFEGTFSHAVRKRPGKGDYRVQSQFGGTVEDEAPSQALIAQARACLDCAPALPLYARVDGIVREGRFLLMELEIFEPLLFLSRSARAAALLADALLRRLQARAAPTN